MQFVKRPSGVLARDWMPADPITGERRRITAMARTRGAAREALDRKRSAALASSGAVATPSRLTLGGLIAAWQASSSFAETTTETVAWALALVPQTLLATSLDKITPGTLEALYAWLMGPERGLGAGTVRRLHGVIRAAYGAGERWGWLTDNTARRAKPPAPAPRRLEVPSASVVTAAIAKATEADAQWGLFLRLLATTGMRKGEAIGLTWGHLDLETGTARIRRSVSSVSTGVAASVCKTPSSRRDVPLEATTVALLRARRLELDAVATELGDKLDGDWHVWPGERNGRYGREPISPSTIKARWHRERDGLGLAKVRMHDLRHFAATQMLAAGVDPVTVAAILGHANPSITLGIYAHLVSDRARAAAKIMGDLLAS